MAHTDRAADSAQWPDLTLSEWEGTKDALHLWTQVVGKVRLALEPMINHWWQVPLYVSARGLTTSLMHAGGLGVEMEFDFRAHRLEVRTTRGSSGHVALGPQSVAEFYAATLGVLRDLGVVVELDPWPQEMPDVVPFPEDTAPRPYDADAVERFWLALVQIVRVMTLFRSRYQGKVSPVHFFWGADDLAVSRFSGRAAPRHPGGVPHCADWVQEMAYSHEVSSCGFWPGGSTEGSFYAYAYPAPEGFADWAVEPAAAFYDATLGEFILPYGDVRRSSDPDAALLAFFESTYEAAADLAGWDRAALEVGPDGPSRGLPRTPLGPTST
jgi:hypothetical protein